MDGIWTAVISTAVTVFVSLLVTFIFNKVSGMPAEIKKQKKGSFGGNKMEKYPAELFDELWNKYYKKIYYYSIQ